MANGTEEKRSYLQNWISVIGGVLSAVSLAVIVFFFILDVTAKEQNPYVGVFAYFALPSFLIFSLALILVGAWWERHRRFKGIPRARFPRIDFNNPVHQRWTFILWGVLTLLGLFSVVGVYRAYHFTESTAFCGLLCHQVMKPEYVAYQHSPHARVACVECHVGGGVKSYVGSKITGAEQLIAVATGSYPRPIETPVKSLRPAQETCEQCHWPQQFFGAVQKEHHYFLTDEKNSEWETRMLMYVGGGAPPLGQHEGIHWHMNIKEKVYYVATDEKRQMIPWIKVVKPDGKEEFYIDKETKYTPDNPPKGEMRRMDCMDCHNRPSHIFKSPEKAVNEAISLGEIDRSIPFIKREAVKVLTGDYKSQEEAQKVIREKLESFYQNKYPDVRANEKEALEKTVQAVQRIYKNYFFPEMKVSWKAYPDNIGHHIFPGCFRCHDEKHQNAQGKVLSRDCSICHAIIEQGPPDALEKNTDGLQFKHPDGDESWKEINCYDCHTGS